MRWTGREPTDSVAATPLDELNTTPTLTALKVARLLLPTEENRVPERLPTNQRQLRATINGLENVAADYAELALQHHSTADQRSRAYAMMIWTRTAQGILAVAFDRVRARTATTELPHAVAEAVALAVLTARLIQGDRAGQLAITAQACADHVATAYHREVNVGGTSVFDA